MTVSGTFGAMGESATIFLRKGDGFTWSLSGTWVATVLLEYSENGGKSWKSWELAQANVAEKTQISPRQRIFRFRCTAYTSGTVTYSIAAATTETLHEFKDANGDTILAINEDGVAITGTVSATGTSLGADDVTAGNGLAKTGTTLAVDPEASGGLEFNAGKLRAVVALRALHALVPAADRLAYYDGAGSAALATLTTFGRSLLDDVDAATARGTLGFTSPILDRTAPGDIGGVTPGDGSFAELSATGTLTIAGAITPTSGEVTIGGGLSIADASNIQTGTTTGSILAATAAQKLGIWGATPVVQPAHIADPAAAAAITATSVTLTNMADGSADNTLVNIGDTSVGDESANIEQNFDKIGDEINALVVDVAALKTAIDGQKTALDALLAQLATTGLQAAA